MNDNKVQSLSTLTVFYLAFKNFSISFSQIKSNLLPFNSIFFIDTNFIRSLQRTKFILLSSEITIKLLKYRCFKFGSISKAFLDILTKSAVLKPQLLKLITSNRLQSYLKNSSISTSWLS